MTAYQKEIVRRQAAVKRLRAKRHGHRISARELRAAGGCREGVARFEALFPTGFKITAVNLERAWKGELSLIWLAEELGLGYAVRRARNDYSLPGEERVQRGLDGYRAAFIALIAHWGTK